MVKRNKNHEIQTLVHLHLHAIQRQISSAPACSSGLRQTSNFPGISRDNSHGTRKTSENHMVIEHFAIP